MSRILIAYASTHGQTKEIAQALAGRLETRGHEVELANAELAVPEPDDFDAVIIGSRVQNGKHAGAIATYVLAHRTRLINKHTAFFSVSMSAAQRNAGDDPNQYLARFFAETAWRPGCSVAFGGALRYRQYGWVLRQVMRFLARHGGHSTDTSRDHVYTDWAAVTRFADHVARALAPAASAGTAA